MRAKALEMSHCPCDGEQIGRMVSEAVGRAEEARSFRKAVLRRYAAAACVSAMMVVGSHVYANSLPSLPRSTDVAVSRQVLDTVISNILVQGGMGI